MWNAQGRLYDGPKSSIATKVKILRWELAELEKAVHQESIFQTILQATRVLRSATAVADTVIGLAKQGLTAQRVNSIRPQRGGTASSAGSTSASGTSGPLPRSLEVDGVGRTSPDATDGTPPGA